MRAFFGIVFLVLILILTVAAIFARHSSKSIGKTVCVLICTFLFPITGNLILVVSDNKILSETGCYIYYIGMDILMYGLIRFTFEYCDITWPSKLAKCFTYALLVIDVVQFGFNPFFRQAFETEKIMVAGAPYYRLVPYMGQTYHRVVCYGIIISLVALYLMKILRTPKIYAEKYIVIFVSFIIGILWQTIMIFSRTPIDKSMIGFGIFCILVFYFSLFYKTRRLLDRMLSGIVSEMPDAMFFYDGSHRCIWANEPGKQLTGIQGNRFEMASKGLIEKFGAVEDRDVDWNMNKALVSEDGVRYYSIEKRTVYDAKNRVSGSFISVRDNTEEQRNIRAEIYNATHDILTGLYNREYLYERVRKQIEENPNVRYRVAFLDVKGFKIVNDVFGNQFGDLAIKTIAKWLRTTFSGKCLHGRLGGDTFGFMVPANYFDKKKVENDLDNFVVKDKDKSYKLMIHIGVYEVIDPSVDVSAMFDRARMAITTIKEDVRKHLAYYDDNMRSMVLWDQQITQQALGAIEEKQIRPYLQPIVDRNGKVVGAEALVRWLHPEHGFLSPGKFVPAFEKNGLIAEVDKYMWRSACEILSRWRRSGRDMFISVNISPKDFYFMDVPATLKKYVKDYGVNPARLRVEVTETLLINDIEKSKRTLNELRDAGFVVEMDDFGSGYSSLNMLKEIPVDVLKIDMMFLRETGNNEETHAKALTIVENIIHMSKDLKIESLTEGVETEEQYRTLSKMGCQLFQGYHFAKPIPVDEFEQKYPKEG
jgi:diguanylate cyclase (GGDEF)-like protein